jgi:hypothetical protein
MVGRGACWAWAIQTCSGGLPISNVCLRITQVTGGNYAVHVGIDDVMSLSDCHAIIDPPGDPFLTVVMSGSTQLFIVPETDIGCSADFGLSADFDTTVLPSQLGGRRVLARIFLFDPRFGIRTFDTPTLAPPYWDRCQAAAGHVAQLDGVRSVEIDGPDVPAGTLARPPDPGQARVAPTISSHGHGC